MSGVTTAQVAAIVAGLRGAPVLTISDVDDFAQLGGIAQMFVENGRMRFDLNLEAGEARPAPAQLEASRAGARVHDVPATGTTAIRQS